MMVKLTITEPDLEVREPALARGSLAALGSLLAVLVARRLGVDPELVAGAVAGLAPLVTAFLVRAGVFAPATVARLMQERER